MNRLRFFILVGLEICILLTYVLKDFKGPKLGVISLDQLAREQAESLAKQDLKPDSLTKTIQKATQVLNQELKAFAAYKKVALFSAQALKGGAEDFTEEFKTYVSQKQKGQAE